MKHVPFRLMFFVVALVVLGVYAAAVTIPNVFTAGEPILAEEVNENFATLATALDELAIDVDALSDTGSGGDGSGTDLTALIERIGDVETDVAQVSDGLDVVTQDLATLETDVEALTASLDAPPQATEVMPGGLNASVVHSKDVPLFDEQVTTTTRGRWLVHKGVLVTGGCGAGIPRVAVTLDGTMIPATAVALAPNSTFFAFSGFLTGITERVLEPGTYDLGVVLFCSSGAYVSGDGDAFVSTASIVVLPE